VLRSAKMFKTATDYAVAFEGFLPIYNLGTMRKSLHFRKSSHFNPQDRFACSVACRAAGIRPPQDHAFSQMKALPHRMKQQQEQR
jgi:hypothetical protein